MTEADISRGWAVRVPGTPATKGSLKCVGRHARGSGASLKEQLEKKLKPWRKQVVAGGLVLPVTGLVGPLGCEITVTIERPTSHYRTGRNAHRLRDAAPEWPSQEGTGDVDKYARAVLDSLQKGRAPNLGAGTMQTDSQVVELTVRKCYPDSPYTPDQLDRPGAVIRLWPYGEDT